MPPTVTSGRDPWSPHGSGKGSHARPRAKPGRPPTRLPLSLLPQPRLLARRAGLREARRRSPLLPPPRLFAPRVSLREARRRAPAWREHPRAPPRTMIPRASATRDRRKHRHRSSRFVADCPAPRVLRRGRRSLPLSHRRSAGLPRMPPHRRLPRLRRLPPRRLLPHPHTPRPPVHRPLPPPSAGRSCVAECRGCRTVSPGRRPVWSWPRLPHRSRLRRPRRCRPPPSPRPVRLRLPPPPHRRLPIPPHRRLLQCRLPPPPHRRPPLRAPPWRRSVRRCRSRVPCVRGGMHSCTPHSPNLVASGRSRVCSGRES